MNYSIASILGNIAGRILPSGDDTFLQVPKISMIQAVDMARREWVSSKQYFESVSDPDLVDHAIYVMEAAQKKYVYLLKKAREMGINIYSED